MSRSSMGARQRPGQWGQDHRDIKRVHTNPVSAEETRVGDYRHSVERFYGKRLASPTGVAPFMRGRIERRAA